MRILIDGIHLGPRAKGVGLYTRNVIEELTSLEPSLELSILLLDDDQTWNLGQPVSLKTLKVDWHNHLWHGFRTVPEKAAALRPDAVWMPYETPLGRLPVPFLMVCHDIPREIRRAQEAGGGGRRSPVRRLRDWLDDRLLTRTLRQAELLFSNSRFVARGVAAESGVSEARIRLAPCAPAADFESLSRQVDVAEVRRELEMPQGYVLCFFTGDFRENLQIVPLVYDRLVQTKEPHGLVVAGLSSEDRKVAEALFAARPWGQRVKFLPFFEAGEQLELARIYTAASAYLDPSLQEGFGMQVIEAMACGIPVVCSDRGALPEVAGGAAALADPTDPEALANQLLAVLRDPAHRSKMVEIGARRAREFTWRRTAESIHQGLRDVAERR